MSSPAPTESDQLVEFDPTFLHARREAIVIFLAWFATLVWCVPYCYLNGYGLAHDNVSTIWGIPSWLFWGIAIPWGVANLFTVWFCLCYMKLDDLTIGAEADAATTDDKHAQSAGDSANQEDTP